MNKQMMILSNELSGYVPALEKAMTLIYEERGMEIVVDSGEIYDVDAGAYVIQASSVDLDSTNLINKLEKYYQGGIHIILYKPTNYEINRVYSQLQGLNYFSGKKKTESPVLFGLKLAEGNMCYILEEYNDDSTVVARSIADFMENKLALSNEHLEYMLNKAKKTISERDAENINLSDYAQKYSVTKQFSLAQKNFSLSFFITSCHEFKTIGDEEGRDWYFIQQYGILNGAGGYSKYWAGSRVDVNNESWYVGQGQVCLHYVDYYQMTNSLILDEKNTDSDDSDENSSDNKNNPELVFVEPQAINKETSYTVSESVSISSSVGFEGSNNGKKTGAKGTASLSAGASFNSSYSFNVSDCTCIGTSLSDDSSSAGWKYSFKRASQNRSAGKWQYLNDPADLAISTFSPENSWVWTIPTSERAHYKKFKSVFEIEVVNTISRYSGSQSPKHIIENLDETEKKKEFEITLPLPPLMALDKNELIFSNVASTKTIQVAANNGWVVECPKDVDWLSVNPCKSTNSESSAKITVKDMPEENVMDRSTTLIFKRISETNDEENVLDTDEEVSVSIFQSSGSVES